MKVTNRIKSVLAEKQVSGKWIVEQIVCTANIVSRWDFNFQLHPSLESLFEVADALDVREFLRPSK